MDRLLDREYMDTYTQRIKKRRVYFKPEIKYDIGPGQTADTPDTEEQVQFLLRNPMGSFNFALNIPKPIFKLQNTDFETFSA